MLLLLVSGCCEASGGVCVKLRNMPQVRPEICFLSHQDASVFSA